MRILSLKYSSKNKKRLQNTWPPYIRKKEKDRYSSIMDIYYAFAICYTKIAIKTSSKVDIHIQAH